MGRIKYGSIEADVNWQWPTREIFESWKCDFFKLEETKFFDIYLVGGFLEKMNGKREHTQDVDIILTKNENRAQIKKLIHEGTKLGIEKYNVFFDILWFDNLLFYSELKRDEVVQTRIYLLSDRWIIDGELKKQYHNAIQVEEDLWQMQTEYPTEKQLQLINSGYMFSNPVLLSENN
ncbi:MAG: hypothetical protein J0L69_09955 [Bacteroidetes bacterium]|nr:hypothetical protein [Bacteroidota bacterium]